MNIKMTSSDGVTLNTAAKYCTENITVTPTTETKTVAATYSDQTVTASDGVVGMTSVTVTGAEIPSYETIESITQEAVGFNTEYQVDNQTANIVLPIEGFEESVDGYIGRLGISTQVENANLVAIKLSPETLKAIVTRADYNQNDSNELDYIKNRPAYHYANDYEPGLLAETTFSLSSYNDDLYISDALDLALKINRFYSIGLECGSALIKGNHILSKMISYVDVNDGSVAMAVDCEYIGNLGLLFPNNQIDTENSDVNFLIISDFRKQSLEGGVTKTRIFVKKSAVTTTTLTGWTLSGDYYDAISKELNQLYIPTIVNKFGNEPIAAFGINQNVNGSAINVSIFGHSNEMIDRGEECSIVGTHNKVIASMAVCEVGRANYSKHISASTIVGNENLLNYSDDTNYTGGSTDITGYQHVFIGNFNTISYSGISTKCTGNTLVGSFNKIINSTGSTSGSTLVGYHNTVSSDRNMATALGTYNTFGSNIMGSVLLGHNNTSNYQQATAFGIGLTATADAQVLLGRFNSTTDTYPYLLVVGNGYLGDAGTTDVTHNAMTLTRGGDLNLAGSILLGDGDANYNGNIGLTISSDGSSGTLEFESYLRLVSAGDSYGVQLSSRDGEFTLAPELGDHTASTYSYLSVGGNISEFYSPEAVYIGNGSSKSRIEIVDLMEFRGIKLIRDAVSITLGESDGICLKTAYSQLTATPYDININAEEHLRLHAGSNASLELIDFGGIAVNGTALNLTLSDSIETITLNGTLLISASEAGYIHGLTGNIQAQIDALKAEIASLKTSASAANIVDDTSAIDYDSELAFDTTATV